MVTTGTVRMTNLTVGGDSGGVVFMRNGSGQLVTLGIILGNSPGGFSVYNRADVINNAFLFFRRH